MTLFSFLRGIRLLKSPLVKFSKKKKGIFLHRALLCNIEILTDLKNEKYQGVLESILMAVTSNFYKSN